MGRRWSGTARGLLLVGVEGTLMGAATGSFLGALANGGIAEEHMRDYAQRVCPSDVS